MLYNEEFNVNKTLTDIIDPEILEVCAAINWNAMQNSKKKQKGFIYNKILQKQWDIGKQFEWTKQFEQLDALQKRMLIKKELINAYNVLDDADRSLFNQYLDISKDNKLWITLTQDERRKIFSVLFKSF